MNVAHLHLLLNHVPTVGSAVALGLLIMALVRRDEGLKHGALEVLFGVALLTLPVYISGVAAYRELRDQPGVPEITALLHQDVALFGFAWLELAGFVGWTARWQTRRRGRAASGMVAATVVLLAVSLGVMARAASLGGEIRHPEIRTAGSAATGAIDPEQFAAAAVSNVSVNSTWAWPAAEAVHFLGLALVFGVLLAVNLRILGVGRQVAFADVHRLLPWGMLGFGANLITGMFFFVGQPGQYVGSSPFYWKVAFLMIAGANFLYLTVFERPWAVNRPEPSLADKAMAVASIVAWLGVLYGGRMLPFLGRAF